jgi:CheY-like chemotaxis protein
VDSRYVNEHPEARPGLFACLSVTDTGLGMDAETLNHIFEPFFTTKGPGKGTGLGLATVYGIASQHHGWITVDSQPGKGTTFKVYFPAASKAQEQNLRQPRPVLLGGNETILVVEDEPALRELVREILRQKGYQVLAAASGLHALQICNDLGGAIDLLLTDIMLPEGVLGHELANLVWTNRPDLKVIFTSGYSPDTALPDGLSTGRAGYLQKPYPPEALVAIVRETLDRTENVLAAEATHPGILQAV